MIPLDEAKEYVLSRISMLSAQQVPILEALGLVTAQDALAQEPIPAWDNTAMDGFAVLASDTAEATQTSPVVLDVVGTLAAGAMPDDAPKVSAGKAVRIMTGAPIPDGADAIVQVEHAEAVGGVGTGRSEVAGLSETAGLNEAVSITEATNIAVSQPVTQGLHIRRAGEDLKAGQVAVPKGSVLSPAHLGVLASIGLREVSCLPRPKVAVFSTGDELVSGGGPLAKGQIRDSNRHSLLALLQDSAIPVDGGVVPDNKEAIQEAFTHYAKQCDAVITTGGVSMGDFDYVKVVLDELGDMRWMQIAIRPAKPLAFGTIGGTPVFGLPGNPVSCMVSFELFARPALRKMAGHQRLYRQHVKAITQESFPRKPDGKTHFARVRWHWDSEASAFKVSSAGGQGSHQLSAMAEANGLAIIPDGDGIAEASEVEVMLLRD